MRGDVVRHDVTVPEGKSLEETAALAAPRGVAAESFWRAAREPRPIHDLDPEAATSRDTSFRTPMTCRCVPMRAALVARMVQRFRAVISPGAPRLAPRGLTLRQVVTLASHRGARDGPPGRALADRRRVPQPFAEEHAAAERSDDDLCLAQAPGAGTATSARSDLALTSAYNTYVSNGLPPGPIASPGREALLAVLAPADVADIYFVSRNDGSHEFSETLAEHARAVDRYQRRRSSPAGEQD